MPGSRGVWSWSWLSRSYTYKCAMSNMDHGVLVLVRQSARGFASPVDKHRQQAITFWESDSARWADECLARFDATPARREVDWAVR